MAHGAGRGSGEPRVRGLTIGEAAARLAGEFPRLRPETLRLMERRGLLAPRRTPAGYRRYTERDLDTVRQILLEAAPLAATVQLAGTQLVENLDVRAGRDTVHGGLGNDTLVGDNDTSVVQASGGLFSGMLSSLGRLLDRLGVASANDTLTGDGGTDTLEAGNRATAAAPLVRNASVSAKGSGTPSAPVIDWNGRLDPALPATSSSTWLESFVNGLGREENPNSQIRIEL